MSLSTLPLFSGGRRPEGRTGVEAIMGGKGKEIDEVPGACGSLCLLAESIFCRSLCAAGLGLGWGLGVQALQDTRGYLPGGSWPKLDVLHPFPGLLTTNQCLEYISQRHQLLKHVSISGFWPFLPFQSSQWLEPAWLMCPRLAEPSDFTVLHMLDNSCPPCLSLTWH